ncbi:hypothetical protein [Nocardia sp. NPDC057353]|uniref:hypothetical protein n=1 Tax=Nocardia sp. NPDC057353 TaxID=3346104 RepID=UPI003639EFCC
MIVIAQDSTFSGPEKLVRRWFESWHGPDRGLGGIAVFGCTLPGVAGGPGRRADILVWTPEHCTVVEIAGLRRSQSGVLDTEQRWRIGSAPADLDLPVASLTPDVRAAQTATGLRARLKRAGLPGLVGELAVLVTAPGSAVSHPEPLDPAGVGVVVAGSADHEAIERYFRRPGEAAARWDVAVLTAAFAELGLEELLPSAEALVREGFAAAEEISAAEVAAQGVGTPVAESVSGGGGVTPSDTGEVAAVSGTDAAAPAAAPGTPVTPSAATASEPPPAVDDLEPDDPRRADSPAPARVPAMAAAAPGRPPWLAPIPPLPERPRLRAGARRSEPSAVTEVDTPRPPAPGPAGVDSAEASAPGPAVATATEQPTRSESGSTATAAPEHHVWSRAGAAAPAQTWRPEPTGAAAARHVDGAGSPPRSPITDQRPAAPATPPTETEAEPRPPVASPSTPQPRSRGVRLTRTPAPEPTPQPAYAPPPTEHRPPRHLEYRAEPQPLRPLRHYSPPPTRGQKLRTAFDTENWPRFQVGGTALLLGLAALVALFFVGVHVARENRPALADYAAMCDRPEPFAGAAEPRPGPVGVYAAGDLNAVSPPNDPALPRATRPEDVQWVACATRTGVGAPVANCRYPDGSELALIAGRYRLTVYEARTGRTVHQGDLPGDWFAPGTIPISDPCAATAGAAPDQPGQRFGRPAPDQLRQFLTDAVRTRGLPS